MDKNTNKLILSVGAGYTQYPFIEALKKRGYRIAAFGRGRNDLRAIQLCDYFKEIDTSDIDSAIDWIKSLPEPINAVGSFSGGVAITTMQKIVKEFGLPTEIGRELMVGMNKFEQQALYEKYNLSTIKSYTVSQFHDNIASIESGKDYIVKPSVGRGSSGVKSITSEKLIEQIKNEQLDKHDIIQELRRGKEYRILAMIQEKEIKLLAPILRDSLKGTFLLGRLSYDDIHLQYIDQYLNDLVNVLQLKDTLIKADILVSESSIDMIEMDIGVGGGIYYKNYISKLFEYDLINEYINLILSEKVQSKVVVNKGIVMDYVYNQEGVANYNLEYCKKVLSEYIGEVEIIPNLLKPKNIAKYNNNSDFAFCVIHNNKNIDNYQLNVYVNRYLFER